MKYSGIGGQAVLEGIMMKNKDNYATAVRKPDGEIVVKKDTYVSMTEKVKFFSLPFVRGIFSFADSMILGMRSLTWSASFFEDDEEDEEPGKFEKFLIDTFGEKVDNVVMSAVMVFSIFMAIAIFMVLPLLIAGIFRKFIQIISKSFIYAFRFHPVQSSNIPVQKYFLSAKGNYFIFYFFKTNQCFHQYINLCFKQSVKGMYYCTNIPHSHELFLTLPT